MPELEGIHYDAFISYRHCELDSFVAENLHRKLESFKLPKSVRSKVKNGKTKITRVFRDVDELPLSEDLSDPINNALSNTDFLITICTPRYPLSRWCMKEIEVFLQSHSRDHILVVLAEDEPYNSFPEILTFEDVEVKDENGNIRIEKREIEPLAADTRGANKKEILKAMDTAVMKLCAAIFGLNYDDLKQRHREARMKKLATIFGSIGAAVLCFAIFATVMLIKISRQNVLISNQYNELQDKYAGSMAAASEKLMSVGRRKDAVYALRSVLPDQKDDKVNVEVLKDLYSTLNIYGTSDGLIPKTTYDMQSEVVYSQISPDGKYALLDDYSEVCIFDVETGEKIETLKADNPEDYYEVVFCCTDGVIIMDSDKVKYHSIGTDQYKDLPELEQINMSFYDFCDAVSEDVTLAFSDDILYGIDNNGNYAFTIDVGETFGGVSGLFAQDFYFYEDTFALSMTDYEYYYLLAGDSKTGEIIIALWNYGDMDVHVALDDEFLYFNTFDQYAVINANSSKLYSINLNTGDTMWARELGDCYIYGIYPNEGNIFVYDSDTVYVLDRTYGSALNFYKSNNEIINAFIQDDYLYYLCLDGRIFACNDLATFDYTSGFYTIPAGDYITNSYYLDGDLYLQFRHANYLVRYTTEKSNLLKKIDYEAKDGEYIDYEVDDILNINQDINPKLVDSAFYSDDRKYVFVICTNYTAQILDASTGKSVKSLILEDLTMNAMKYSDVTNGYILLTDYNSFVLNDAMDITCKIPFIETEKDGEFIMIDSDMEYCTAPFVDYDELIKKADELLAGYEPSSDIKNKYNIK